MSDKQTLTDCENCDHMRCVEELESENMELKTALERIASEVGTSTLAHKIAQEALNGSATACCRLDA